MGWALTASPPSLRLGPESCPGGGLVRRGARRGGARPRRPPPDRERGGPPGRWHPGQPPALHPACLAPNFGAKTDFLVWGPAPFLVWGTGPRAGQNPARSARGCLGEGRMEIQAHGCLSTRSTEQRWRCIRLCAQARIGTSILAGCPSQTAPPVVRVAHFILSNPIIR